MWCLSIWIISQGVQLFLGSKESGCPNDTSSVFSVFSGVLYVSRSMEYHFWSLIKSIKSETKTSLCPETSRFIKLKAWTIAVLFTKQWFELTCSVKFYFCRYRNARKHYVKIMPRNYLHQSCVGLIHRGVKSTINTSVFINRFTYFCHEKQLVGLFFISNYK